jgi:hypothetical protein
MQTDFRETSAALRLVSLSRARINEVAQAVFITGQAPPTGFRSGA